MNYKDKNIKKINEDKTIGIIIVKKNDKYIMEYCSDKRIISKTYELVWYNIYYRGDCMYYHASRTKDIKVLEPRVSNHKVPLIYFSSKRENVLVYLSNAIEKYCKESGFVHEGIYTTWASYGFTEDGKLRLEEYYPNATIETYKGVSGYIYHINEVPNIEKLNDIPFAFKTSTPTKIDSVEYIPDAYEAIVEEVNKGNIVLIKYEEYIKTKKDWLERTIKKEYDESASQPEYRYFLESKFKFLKK